LKHTHVRKYPESRITPSFAEKAIRWRFHRGRVGRPAGGQLAIFGLMAAIVAALWVRETLVALAPRAIEAAAGD
jgi:hypothetical protein